MKKRRTPPRVLRHLRPCPDCNASAVGARLQHEDSCPLQAAVDAQCDADRQWFAAHPDELYFTRAISPAEYETLRHVDPAGAATEPNHVHIWNAPWGRVRQFCTGHEFSALALDPDEAAS